MSFMTVKATASEAKLPIKLRLKAWWEGYDPSEIEARLRDRMGDDDIDFTAAADEAIDLESDVPFDPWDSKRIDVSQFIWGEGYCGPGGSEHIITMSKLLTLSPELSMLVIGAGLGGPARTLSEHFGVWITAYEESEALVNAGNELSTMAGMAKKVPIVQYDPEETKEFDRNFDRAFAKECLFHIKNKLQILSAINNNLKPEGLVLATEYTVNDEAFVGTAGYKKWKECEPGTIHPVTKDEFAGLIAESGLQVRVNEDVSEQYIKLIANAWSGADEVIARLTQEEDGKTLTKTLLREAEFWNCRSELLKAGDISVRRVLAYKKEAKKGMMSNW